MLMSMRCGGACAVLCNYLDGAVADYENGDVDNLVLIEDSIEALKILGDYSYKDYKQRVEKVKGEKDYERSSK